MNAEARRILLECRQEEEEIGKARSRRQSLKNLKLKTVIKESHCTPVTSLEFNRLDSKYFNLFATTGSVQATIYDDTHMGKYVDIINQYVSSETKYCQGGELRASTWLSACHWSEHPQGDACIAVSGADTDISVISIVESRVVRQLRGHKKEVVGLASCKGCPNLLASLSKDGELRLWNVALESALACCSSDACSLAVHPDGLSMVTGSKKGVLRKWEVPQIGLSELPAQKGRKRPKLATAVDLPKEVIKLEGENSHSDAVDCLQFLDALRLLSKSTSGRFIVTNWQDGKQLASWKGEVFVYDTATGSRLMQLAAIKVTGPVRACGISDDCRHLLAAMGNGFIFRFEANANAAEESANISEGLATEE